MHSYFSDLKDILNVLGCLLCYLVYKLCIFLSLWQRGAEVHLVPLNHDISQMRYDGLFISNGPGDPALCTQAIENIKQVSLLRK